MEITKTIDIPSRVYVQWIDLFLTQNGEMNPESAFLSFRKIVEEVEDSFDGFTREKGKVYLLLDLPQNEEVIQKKFNQSTGISRDPFCGPLLWPFLKKAIKRQGLENYRSFCDQFIFSAMDQICFQFTNAGYGKGVGTLQCESESMEL